MMIRMASRSDAPDMRSIYNHAIESRMSTCDLESRLTSDIEAWFNGRDMARPIYVYDVDGGCIGYLSVSDFWNNRPGYRVTADCGVYVDPHHQGEGIGSALLEHFLEQAPALGLESVVTSMFADNRASVRLFDKFGFTRVGLCQRVANLEGQWKDLVIVQRAVAS